MAATFIEAAPAIAEQAQVFIDQAVQWVVSECGQLPVDLPPTDELMVAARTAANGGRRPTSSSATR